VPRRAELVSDAGLGDLGEQVLVQADAVLHSIAFRKKRTGQLPEEVIFDSRLTTYANLNRLNHQGVAFITLRRRSPALLQAVAHAPTSVWRRIEREGVSRFYRTPRALAAGFGGTGVAIPGLAKKRVRIDRGQAPVG
jgi:hypothetical protein